MQINKLPDGTIYTKSNTPNGVVCSYSTTGDREALIKEHQFNVSNSDILFYQTLQMHRDIVNGDYDEEMKQWSRQWLKSKGKA